MRVSGATKSLQESAREYERAVLRYVCPIVSAGDGGAESIGSGFLLQIPSALILLTASHVLQRAPWDTLQIPAGSRTVPVKGRPFISVQPDAKGDERFGLDIGFVVLNTNEMLASPSTPVLSIDGLDVGDTPAEQTAYGFAGAPSARNEFRQGIVDAQGYFYGGRTAERRVYHRLGLSSATHFVMRFERERMLAENGVVTAVPKPHGMSGGPVFKLGTFSEIREGAACPRVIAIGIEWNIPSRVLVGVRIGVALDVIRQLLPHLEHELPEPTFFSGHATLR